MALDVLQNYAEATVTTSLNGTDAPGTADTVTVSALAGAWVGLAAGQQMRVMDKADLASLSTSYEIMILTANASGAAGSWTVTRGAEGSTVKAHTANWTMVPVDTAGGLDGRYRSAAAPVYTVGAATAPQIFQGSNNGLGGGVFTDGTAYAIPVLGYGSMPPIKVLAVEVNSGGSAGALYRFGLYADDGSQYPGALIVDAGTVDASTASGFNSQSGVTLATPQIIDGLGWIVVVPQGAPATGANVQQANLGHPLPVLGADTMNDALYGRYTIAYSTTGVSGALPSTFPSGATKIQSVTSSNAAYPLVVMGF